MRSRYLLWIFLSVFLLGTGNPSQAQKSLNHYSDSQIWQSANEKFQNKNFGAARREFQEFVNRSSTEFSDRKSQAEFYMALCSIELFRPGAEEEMKAFIRNYPESNKIQSAYFQLGRQQYRNKKYKAALLWFQQVDPYLLHHDDLSEYRFKLGYSYFRKKDYENARKNFYEIIEVSGDYNAPANYYYSHIAYLNKNYQTALSGFEKLEANKTFAPIVPYYICQIYFLQEQYQKLLSYAPKYLDDASVKRQGEIAKMIGLAHYQIKEYAKAIPYLEKGKKTLVREDRFAYGYCLYKEKKFEQAIQQFERVGGEDDEMLQVATFCLADCYLKSGNKNGAKVAFASAARMDFDKNMQQDALFNYAKLTYELSYSPFNETIKAFDEYLQKYPDSDRNDEAYDYLVKVYMTTKNYSDALASMDKIRNKTPEIEKAYQRVSFLRGLELMKQLKYEEAIQAFDLSWKYRMYNSNISAERLYWKAEANYRLGNLNEAISQFKTFLVSPGSGTSEYFGQAYYNIAYANFDQDKYDEASDWFRKYVNQANEKDEFVSDAFNRIGDCFFLDRNYNKAAEFYAKAARIDSWDADYALYQQAFCMGLLNQPNEKARLLEQVKSKYPKSDYSDDALFELAQAKVKMDQQREAAGLYHELVKNHPNSSFAAKALVQLGLMNYNLKEYEKAIINYKAVITDYPQSQEKQGALIGLKNVYVDLNRVNEYFAFVESAGSGTVLRRSEKDSLSYISAERLYMSGKTEQGITAFESYLSNYPYGMFRLNAQYYKADAALNQKDYETALVGFEEVVDQPDNLFTEKALLAASQLNYRNENYDRAKGQYQRLTQRAEIPENRNVAKVGYMRCVYHLNEFENVIPAATEVLEMPKIQEEMIREATYKRAKSYLSLAKNSEALIDLKSLSNEVQSVEGAEAKFRIAEVYFAQSKFNEAENEINQFIEMNSPHHYWLAESFLLLSDVFLKKNDEFQAKYTLQSIVDNYGSKEDGILERAQQKLNVLLKAEKQKEQEIANQAVELQFEGSDSIQNKKLFEEKAAKSDSLGLDEERLMLQEMLDEEKEIE
ncbi:tetratricopeptide repeat protein [Marinifilum caeruleilacunae]|uniref:Tetratricopeptide repeat protein n=1 Tax=Marinifilum caeruleilacunae TaxID=2499076 RepID=A0ABX1WXN6_9BACT|nr:tetratricopeptide repeat protein [Marinifilum caeruleilacunae]NOU60900.1 tetratricopeptide repeat protein [Marinifilum caeruleilacunae]